MFGRAIKVVVGAWLQLALFSHMVRKILKVSFHNPGYATALPITIHLSSVYRFYVYYKKN